MHLAWFALLQRVSGAMNLAICPLCDAHIPVPRSLLVGSMLFCPRCDCLLQIVSLDPLETDFPLDLDAGADEPKLGRRNRRNGKAAPRDGSA